MVGGVDLGEDWNVEVRQGPAWDVNASHNNMRQGRGPGRPLRDKPGDRRDRATAEGGE